MEIILYMMPTYAIPYDCLVKSKGLSQASVHKTGVPPPSCTKPVGLTIDRNGTSRVGGLFYFVG